jgi:hypothetical protein
VRPSALLSVLQAAGIAAGAAAALAPHATRNAAIAALQESLTDLNNNNLRLLREAELSDEVCPGLCLGGGGRGVESKARRVCCGRAPRG